MAFDKPYPGIEWLGHAGFRLKIGRKVVYIDPYRSGGGVPADLILITHDHFDHFSPDDLGSVMQDGTTVVGPATVTEQLDVRAVSVAPGETLELAGLDVTAVAAYNTNKLDSDGKPFHPRAAGWVGYVVRAAGQTIYHSGDTDVIPEMDQAVGVDVALLPVSGTYVMTAQEAVEAARRIGPKLAIPMHWGTVVGSRTDAEEFAGAAPVPVEILDRPGEAVGKQA
jgi:L-ascorbate metabolism protein UlaG (beta-lactamase superfamily)